MRRTWQAWQALAVFLTAAVPACAEAAWLGFKNDMPTVIVVQSASMVANQVRLGKPHVLFPGEIAWDAVTAPGLRQISVFDPKQNNRLLHKDLVNCQNVDIFLSVQVIVPPAVKGQPPPQPQIRFIPARPPVMPGILRPPVLVPGAPGGPGAPANPGAPGAPGTPPGGAPTEPGTRPPTGGFTPPANPPKPPPSLTDDPKAGPPAPPPAPPKADPKTPPPPPPPPKDLSKR